MLKNILLCLVLAATSIAAQAQSVSSRALGAPVARNVAYFNQTITLLEGSVVHGSVAPLTTSVDGFGTTKMVTKLAGSPVGQLPQIGVPNPVDRGLAQQRANDWAVDNIDLLQNRARNWLSSQGISLLIYNFNQEIMLSTDAGPKRMAIVFNATVDVNGRPTYGAPKIVDPDPTFIEAIYTPLRAMAGLPTTWQYPNAGTVRWRLMNKRYEEISTWQTINTGGAYDEPAGSGDPDAGLRCLIDSRNPPGCSAPTQTIRQLMDRTGASAAMVSYIRQLAPLYETDPTTGNEVAVAAISVDERTYDCAVYTNKGNYGYVLDLQADVYLVLPKADTTDFSVVNSFGGKGISPTQPYTKTVPGPSLGGLHPDTVIISPEPGSTELWRRNDTEKMKNVIYVAPVVDVTGGGVINFSGTAGYLGMEGQTHRYYVGNNGDNYWGNGMYDQIATFNIPTRDYFSSLRLTRAKYDDLILVNMNGYNIYLGPPSHIGGGDTLYIEYTGASEQYCDYNGTNYSCAQLGNVVGNPTTQCEGGESGGCWYVCPTGSVYSAQTGQCHTFGAAKSYPLCTVPAVYDGGGGGASVMPGARAGAYTYNNWSCFSSACGAGVAQYRSDATGGGWGGGYGCIYPELRTSWDDSINLDMTPFLVAGTNTIFIRTIVAGNGEGFIELKARSCAADLNLDTSAPPGPGARAIEEALRPKAR